MNLNYNKSKGLIFHLGKFNVCQYLEGHICLHQTSTTYGPHPAFHHKVSGPSVPVTNLCALSPRTPKARQIAGHPGLGAGVVFKNKSPWNM